MESVKTKIKAIIFDMDGTIIHTEALWRQVNLALLKKYGITEFSEEHDMLFKSFSGMSMTGVATIMKDYFNLPDSVETLVLTKLDLANELFDQHIDFIDGFELFHAKLQTLDIPMSIATNAMPANLLPIAKKFEFHKLFGGNVFSQADVNYRPKPDPALFLYAAAMLGVKPEECLVFEDSIPGFQAARAAGMKCIAIKNELNAHVLDTVHDAITNYHEAEEAIKKL
jgi:beta-phosphoglucomutase-like phosphatase (HAD superfamily)